MKLSLSKLFINVMLALFLGAVAMTTFGMNPYTVAGGILAVGCLYSLAPAYTQKGHAFMALQVEIWKDTIEEEIRKDNSFLFNSDVVDKEDILNAQIVHLPQSGGGAGVIKNPTNFPLSVIEREDTDIIYKLDRYALKPIRIDNLEKYELSYDKRSSVLRERLIELQESMADQMLYNWVSSPAVAAYSASNLPAANILTVTGDNGSSNADAPAGTGNRKKATLGDLQRMQTLFRSQNRWFNDQMYCLIPPNMLAEIAPADSVITATYMQSVTEQERREGVYMKIQGWKVMSRSSVLATVADGSSIVSPDEVGSATDQGAGLFWYKYALSTALGVVNTFERTNDPTYLGDIYNFDVRLGGRCKREDYKGVALLRQAATA